MFEERTRQFWVVADFGKLRGHARFQFFALSQRPARIAGTLGMTPCQFVRIQVGRIARQKMQSQRPWVEAT